MSTIWIVDGAYLLKGAPKDGDGIPRKFDYKLILENVEKIVGKTTERYYLNSTPNPPSDQQDAFHTWIKSARPRGPQFRVELYKLKEINCECPECHHKFPRRVQKGVDVGIATLLIKLAFRDRFDTVILSAGDGDFEDAVRYVKDEFGKRIIICGYHESMSTDLQSYSEEPVWIDEFFDEIEKKTSAAMPTSYADD